MRTLVRLVSVTVLLVGAAGSSVAAYMVGYAHGLNVHAKTTEFNTETRIEDVPIAGLEPVQLLMPEPN